MICQPIVETSLVCTVASVGFNALITKLVPATTVPTLGTPIAVEAFGAWIVKSTIEDAVIAVVATVAVPAVNVVVPKAFAPAAVVLLAAGVEILLPAVPKTKFPFVAVILPVVAVTPVPAVTVVVAAREVVVVKDPGAVIAEGRVNVTVLPDTV